MGGGDALLWGQEKQGRKHRETWGSRQTAPTSQLCQQSTSDSVCLFEKAAEERWLSIMGGEGTGEEWTGLHLSARSPSATGDMRIDVGAGLSLGNI